MMPSQSPTAREPRGMLSPCCATPFSARSHVAKSYPSPAGQYREYHCQNCGRAIETSETVIGHPAHFLDISDLNAVQIRMVRAQVQILRAHNQQFDGHSGRSPPDRAKPSTKSIESSSALLESHHETAS